MQAQVFDRIARELGAASTRRGFVRLLGGAATLGSGLLLARDADAKKGKHHGKGPRRGKAKHPRRGAAAQAVRCRTLNQSCTQKRPAIGKRRKCCAGLVCRNQRCRIKECSSFLGCGEGRGCCNGVCVDLQRDPRNCGQCGKDCGGHACLGGRCVSPCVDGLTECDGTCVEVLRDPTNCGGCGVACDRLRPGSVCKEGRCTCRLLETECNGACVDTSSSVDHCGACGHACAPGESCESGHCRAATCQEHGQACGSTAECCYPLTCKTPFGIPGQTFCLTLNCIPYGNACDPQFPNCCDGVPCSGGLCRYN
jgi:hypothetical protein